MFNSRHYVFSDKTQYSTQQRSPPAYSKPPASADCSHWLRGQGGGMSQQVFWRREHMWTVFRSLYSLPTQNWFRQEMPCSEEHCFDMKWREPLVGAFDVSCSKRQEQALVNISDRAVSSYNRTWSVSCASHTTSWKLVLWWWLSKTAVMIVMSDVVMVK